MTPRGHMLVGFVNEADRWPNRPLYQAVVELLHQLGIAGATAQAGLMGFGHHMRMHHKGLFGIADDRPITIVSVDEESKLRSALPELRQMVREGLVVMLDAEVFVV